MSKVATVEVDLGGRKRYSNNESEVPNLDASLRGFENLKGMLIQDSPKRDREVHIPVLLITSHGGSRMLARLRLKFSQIPPR